MRLHAIMSSLHAAVRRSGETSARRRLVSALRCTAPLAVSLVTTLATPAMAAFVSWDGGAPDANWSSSTNWGFNATPANGDSVFIGSVGPNANPRVDRATNNIVETRVLTGTLTVDATLNTQRLKIEQSGNLVISARGEVRGSGSLPTQVSVLGTGTGLLNNGTIIGSLNVFADILAGTFSNAGRITGDTILSYGRLNLLAGTNLSNSGLLEVMFGTLNVGAADTVGSLKLWDDAILETLAESLVVSGLAELAGELAFDSSALVFDRDVVEAEILRAGSIAGDFDALSVVAPVGYSVSSRVARDGSLERYLLTFTRTPTPVPVPSALVLAVSALAGLALLRRR